MHLVRPNPKKVIISLSLEATDRPFGTDVYVPVKNGLPLSIFPNIWLNITVDLYFVHLYNGNICSLFYLHFAPRSSNSIVLKLYSQENTPNIYCRIYHC